MSITGDWDRRISRRTLLRTGGSFAAGVTLVGLAGVRAYAQSSYPFTLGVASGDPSQNGVVLWTRLAPDPLAVGGGLPAEPYEVRYEVAKDDGFQKIIRSGSTVALPDEAHSVRIELDDLGPRHECFYRFKAGNDISRTGRTRTTPPGNAMVESVTIAFVSCQNFPDGYFTPYADVADAPDIEAVIHLGDYIYEGSASVVRAHAPRRRTGGDRVHGRVGFHRRRPWHSHPVRRRSEQSAHPVPEQQLRLRPMHPHSGTLDERVPHRRTGVGARVAVVDEGDVRRRERACRSRAGRHLARRLTRRAIHRRPRA
jgi:alkaline phosphatase D